MSTTKGDTTLAAETSLHNWGEHQALCAPLTRGLMHYSKRRKGNPFLAPLLQIVLNFVAIESFVGYKGKPVE